MALSPDTVAAIGERLTAHAGLALPAWVIEARASARIAAVGCSPAEYVALIDSARGASELAALIEAVRVGESRLFRHRSQIDAIAEVVAPALRAQGRRAIRVWSAGCAAGEEPYTLAIVLARALPDCAISIIATDVSGEALAQARTASYPRAALGHVPERYRDCFVDDGDAVRVAPAIAALVRFERANLLDSAAPRGCDLVWCRNVLIYFSTAARRRAIERLVGATRPGGFLFVGYSESLREVAELETERTGDAVYYVRRAAAPGLPGAHGSARAAAAGPGADQRPAAIASAASMPALGSRMADAAAVGPAGALDAGDLRALQGRTVATVGRPPEPTAAHPVARRGHPAAPQLTEESSAHQEAPGHVASAMGATHPTGDHTLARRGHPAAPQVTAESSAHRAVPGHIASATGVTHPTGEHTLALRGHPTAAQVTAEISARLALPGLRALVIDVDGVELLDDDVAPVLRRARSAAWAAGIALELRAERRGPQRWLARHDLDEPAVSPGSPVRRDGRDER